MGLEAATYISQLTATNPVVGDNVSQGDDHLRLLKTVLQAQFPNLGAAAVTATAAELNIIDGVTASTAELNIMDGVTATTAEINYIDGVTSAIQTQLDAKASGIGNWVHIKSVSGSATAAIDFINGSGGVVLDSTYSEYMFEFDNIGGPNESLWMRTTTNASSFDSSASDYEYVTWKTSAGATSFTFATSTGDTKIILGDSLGNGSLPINGTVTLYNPTVANNVLVRSQLTVDYAGAGVRDAVGSRVAGDVDGVRFLWASGGNFAAQGAIRMYGRRKT